MAVVRRPLKGGPVAQLHRPSKAVCYALHVLTRRPSSKQRFMSALLKRPQITDHYHLLPIRNALRMTARLSPMSPTPTASQRVMIPGKASTAKDALMRIAAVTFSLTTDVVFFA